MKFRAILHLNIVVCLLFLNTDSASGNQLSDGEKEKLRSFVTATMQCRDTVGMGVALVRRGETVFAEGFGHRDLDRQLPMTADTRINLASQSKSFTTTVAAEAVDKGFIGWYTPLKDLLGDEFRMQDDFSTQFGSLSDLFAHRIGILTYWGVATASLNISRQELVMRRFQHFDRYYDFRQHHNYANYPYVIGAHAVENATGEEWEDAVTRLFGELGMANSKVSAYMTSEDWDYTAHSYILENGEYIVNPEEDQINFLDNIGPAAGVFSSPNDMAQYLKFHLAEGQTEDGSQLISASVMRDVHTPTSAYSRGSPKNQPPRFPIDDVQFAYGRGWHLGQYRGHEKFYHTGSYSSYSCRMTLLPEADVAVWSCVNSPGDYRGTRANHAVNMYALDVLLNVAECPPVNGPAACVMSCSTDAQCPSGRKCCSNGCGQACMVSVESWLNETTTCTYPDPWRYAPLPSSSSPAAAAAATATGASFPAPHPIGPEDDADTLTSLPERLPRNPFRKSTDPKHQPSTKRALADYAGSYGHLGFGIFTIYEDGESGTLRYRFGALLQGEILPTAEPDEFTMTIEYPISYRMAFFSGYPDGFPVYFSDVNTSITEVAVAYLEFDQPPVFVRGVVPPAFP